MSETSTTATDNAAADAQDTSTTATTAPEATDTKPADSSDNLDETSKSDSTTSSTDDDTQSTGDDSAQDGTPTSQFDPDLDEWISKRKLPAPTDDEQRQSLQDLRNSQREYTRSQQAKKGSEELNTVVNDAKTETTPQSDDDEDDDPLAKDVAALKADRIAERDSRLQSEFYQEHRINDNDNPGLSQAILDTYKEATSRSTTPSEKRQDVEYWSNPARLPMLLQLAKAKLAETVSSTAADEAARSERERIERESQANSPGRAATNGNTTSNKTEAEARLERFKARYNKS